MSAIKPIAHLVWLQGMRAPDDVEDYFEVARPGDKCVDGSDAFPVFAADAIATKDVEIAKLREATEKLADKIEDLIAEFGDDPKAALECVSEYLQLRRQPVQEER